MSKNLIAELRAKRETILDTLEATIEGAVVNERDLTDAENANVESLTAQVEKLSERIDQLTKIEESRSNAADLNVRAGAADGVYSVNEPELYRENGEHNFLADVVNAAKGDRLAEERLHAHNAVELNRASTVSSFGGFVIPDHAVNLYAPSVTEGRPTAGIFESKRLTSNKIEIPLQSGKTRVIPQATENTGDSSPTDFASTMLQVDAKSIIGHTDVSRQSLDFGSFDQSLIISDLLRAYNEQINSQVLNGAGTGGTMKGLITTVAAGNRIDGSTGTTAKALYTVVGKAKTAVYSAINAAATHVIISPELFDLIEHAVDTEGRPVYGFSFSAPSNVQGQGLKWNGLQVVRDSMIPSSGSPAKELAVVVKANEGLLWEQGPRFITVDQVGAHTGTVRFVIQGYAAFTAERRPGALQVIKDIPTPA